jgi:hypothetical protein
MIRRRDFIAGLGIASVWPRAVRAQQRVEEVVISKQVIEGTAVPLYIYADRSNEVGAST